MTELDLHITIPEDEFRKNETYAVIISYCSKPIYTKIV